MSSVLVLLENSLIEVQDGADYITLAGAGASNVTPGQVPSVTVRARGGLVAKVTGTADPESMSLRLESALVHTRAVRLLNSGAEVNIRTTSERIVRQAPNANAEAAITAAGVVTLTGDDSPDPRTAGWGIGHVIELGDKPFVIQSIDKAGNVKTDKPAAAGAKGQYSLVVPSLRYKFAATPNLAVSSETDSQVGKDRLTGQLTLDLVTKLGDPVIVMADGSEVAL